MAHIEDILIKPMITEKASLATEKCNRYGFLVSLKSNKNQIKEAVEKFYDVKVLDVKTSITAGKMKRAGKGFNKSSKTKKALVKLAEGQKIEFFQGV
jgi:large subunit ribosomal protein L23